MMTYDKDRVDDLVLALLHLNVNSALAERQYVASNVVCE